MRKLTSPWIAGAVLIASGITGCRGDGSSRPSLPLFGQRSVTEEGGTPGTAQSRGDNGARSLDGNSYDSNGYLQPVPAPPVDEADSSVPPSPLSRRDSKQRKRSTSTVEHRTQGKQELKLAANDVSSADSVTIDQPAPAGQSNVAPNVIQKMGDGFSNFMSSLAGEEPKSNRVARRRDGVRESSVATNKKNANAKYEPFPTQEQQLVQTKGESAEPAREAHLSRVPLMRRPATERNPVELGLPEPF